MPHIARLDDKVVCPSCKGGQIIVSAAPNATFQGIPIARVGDRISCGAVITTGSPEIVIEGRQVAVVGFGLVWINLCGTLAC